MLNTVPCLAINLPPTLMDVHLFDEAFVIEQADVAAGKPGVLRFVTLAFTSDFSVFQTTRHYEFTSLPVATT